MATLPRKITLSSPDGEALAVYTYYASDEITVSAGPAEEQAGAPYPASLADRARAAFADARDDEDRRERATISEYRRVLTAMFTSRCAVVLDVDETAVEGVSVEVLNNGQRFVATGQVDGMAFEVVTHRDNLALKGDRRAAARDRFPLRVVLPCIGCACDRAFYIDSLADLGKVLADQRCTECGGSIMSALPGYLAVR